MIRLLGLRPGPVSAVAVTPAGDRVLTGDRTPGWPVTAWDL